MRAVSPAWGLVPVSLLALAAGCAKQAWACGVNSMFKAIGILLFG
jgi:hypothetical protein